MDDGADRSRQRGDVEFDVGVDESDGVCSSRECRAGMCDGAAAPEHGAAADVVDAPVEPQEVSPVAMIVTTRIQAVVRRGGKRIRPYYIKSMGIVKI